MCLFLVQENLCVFESCDKLCYIEYIGGTWHIHDYSGKQHAKNHRERIAAAWPPGHVFTSFYIEPSIISIRHQTVINSSNIIARVAMEAGYTLKLVRI